MFLAGLISMPGKWHRRVGKALAQKINKLKKNKEKDREALLWSQMAPIRLHTSHVASTKWLKHL